VARAISGIIFENEGSSWNLRGLRLDYRERQGANCKISGDFPTRFFSMRKYGRLGQQSVDRGRRWSMVDHGQGLGGGLLEFGPAVALGHGGLLRG
jgi:hypothetical protein